MTVVIINVYFCVFKCSDTLHKYICVHKKHCMFDMASTWKTTGSLVLAVMWKPGCIFTCLRLRLWACCGRSLSPLYAGSMGCRRCCQRSQPQSQVGWRRRRAYQGSCYGPRGPTDRQKLEVKDFGSALWMRNIRCVQLGKGRHAPHHHQMLRQNHTVRLSCCQPDLQRRWG